MTDGPRREVVLRADGSGPTAGILVAGDICVAGAYPGPTRSAHPWAELVPLIEAHDVCIAGLECPLTMAEGTIVKVGPTLRADPALANVVRQGGIHVANLANNHIMDHGRQGLVDTLAACSAAGLLTVGAGHDLEAARRPLVVEAEGLRICVIAVAEREFSIAGRTTPGAAPLDPWFTPGQVRAARGSADTVVVVVHGGNEYYSLPRPGLVAACRALVDAGAHAVVCHHSHVPGPFEVHNGAPIVYGLGNFLFPRESPWDPGWYSGYVIGMRVGREGVISFTLAPYEQGRDGAHVRVLNDPEAAGFFEELGRLASIVVEEGELLAAWRRFIAGRRADVLASTLGLTRLERRLVRAGVWPFWRMPRRRVSHLLGVVTCDSHRELLEAVLRESLL
jgi:poly-gamma-glutamate synthesis protein (capsule biosynthesis protein)